MGHRRMMLALVVVSVAFSACSTDSARPSDLWSFQSAALSSDGSQIEIDVYGVPDPSCAEFDRLETEVSGDELIVSLFYLGSEPGQFCNIPCPLGTQKLTIALDDPHDPALTVVKNPATGEHCSELLSPNN